ncbi:hypothetical protein MCU_01363 [Bartonella elizabethae Re6043vi]|uniref:Uncharacterized protein n=1 Tax=Bartonella elizabethae Re6043vi TaxID=1094554 RepID=A0ABP2QMK5_BAREL|nr:hypothetical protein MCU_01363 [Bartonella elizabethae Re6043vi]VEJ41936.1 Uncharacterised protein [Bartonella elizabethae]
MAAYDVFTTIDNMLMEPPTEVTDNTLTYHYRTLAAQAKHLHASYTPFTVALCRCPRFIITGYKNR